MVIKKSRLSDAFFYDHFLIRSRRYILFIKPILLAVPRILARSLTRAGQIFIKFSLLNISKMGNNGSTKITIIINN